ncbi:MAG: GFA family protein [Pseudomonadota bacterium]
MRTWFWISSPTERTRRLGLCGSIRYVITDKPDQTLVCHCPDCRRAAGAQSVAWVFLPTEKFQVTHGILATYSSSPGVTRAFCGKCGTTISWVGDKQPGRIDVTIGSLDEPQKFTPTKAVYRRHRLPWASEI